jgi:hypothetical protein
MSVVSVIFDSVFIPIVVALKLERSCFSDLVPVVCDLIKWSWLRGVIKTSTSATPLTFLLPDGKHNLN